MVIWLKNWGEIWYRIFQRRRCVPKGLGGTLVTSVGGDRLRLRREPCASNTTSAVLGVPEPSGCVTGSESTYTKCRMSKVVWRMWSEMRSEPDEKSISAYLI